MRPSQPTVVVAVVFVVACVVQSGCRPGQQVNTVTSTPSVPAPTDQPSATSDEDAANTPPPQGRGWPELVALAAGDEHTCFVTTNGRVACIGNNDSLQLGLHEDERDAIGEVVYQEVPGLRDVVALSAGARHTCALLTDGAVACWGDNSSEQLGVSGVSRSARAVRVPGLDDAVQISAGIEHTCARYGQGLVRCWGSNAGGQLGGADTTAHVAEVPLAGEAHSIAAGGYQSCALVGADAEVRCWGSAASYADLLDFAPDQTRVLEMLDRPDALSVGRSLVCASDAHQTRCVESALVGRDLPEQRVAVTERAGPFVELTSELQVCALDEQGRVHCSMRRGLQGDGVEWSGGKHLTLHEVCLPEPAVALSQGLAHVCAVSSSGTAWCWGWNADGRSGAPADEDYALLVPFEVGAVDDDDPEVLDDVMDIGAGTAHSCALVDDGSVWCWGHNVMSQLGDGTTAPRELARRVLGVDDATAISVGDYHSCAVTGAGEAYCWGHNMYGELGWSQSEGEAARAGRVECMEGDERAVAVSAAAEHSCALTAAGKVHCWGLNRHGQLGVLPEPITDEQEDDDPPVGPPVCETLPVQGAMSVVALSEWTCAKTSARTLQCWGGLDARKLGEIQRQQPLKIDFDDGIEVLWRASLTRVCAAGTDGHVVCVRPGSETTRESLHTVEVEAQWSSSNGWTHCVTTDNGGVWCWGSNRWGVVGSGTEDVVNSPVVVTGVPGAASRVVVGADHSCALLRSGQVYCWGWDGEGQLGDVKHHKDDVARPDEAVHLQVEPTPAWSPSDTCP